MRLAKFLATFGLLSLNAIPCRSNAVPSKLDGSAPGKPTNGALDITQGHADGESLVIKGADGQPRPLTVDVALQRLALRKLAQAHPEAGAMVAIEVRTGQLKVFSEWPPPASRDASLLLGRQFPAASVFKVVTTAALLEQSNIDPKRIVCTEGGMHAIEREQLEIPRTGVAECGPFSEALGLSRNAAFAQLASRFLKPEDLENYADRFGFDSPVPVEINVPLGHFTTNAEPLAFARSATGFEGSTLSPLGAAYLAYVIAAGGKTLPLHLLVGDDFATEEGTKAFPAIRAETAQALRQMMEVTVRRGTSWRAFHDEHGKPYLNRISVAGKTGTLGEKENTYSWFIGFAPSQAPRIVISVLLKNGRIWQRKANEVGRDWLVEYFSRESSTPKKVPALSNRVAPPTSQGFARVRH